MGRACRTGSRRTCPARTRPGRRGGAAARAATRTPAGPLGRRRPPAAGQLGDPVGQLRRRRPDPGPRPDVDQDRPGPVALGRAAGLAGGQRHRHPQHPRPVTSVPSAPASSDSSRSGTPARAGGPPPGPGPAAAPAPELVPVAGRQPQPAAAARRVGGQPGRAHRGAHGPGAGATGPEQPVRLEPRPEDRQRAGHQPDAVGARVVGEQDRRLRGRPAARRRPSATSAGPAASPSPPAGRPARPAAGRRGRGVRESTTCQDQSSSVDRHRIHRHWCTAERRVSRCPKCGSSGSALPQHLLQQRPRRRRRTGAPTPPTTCGACRRLDVQEERVLGRHRHRPGRRAADHGDADRRQHEARRPRPARSGCRSRR